MKTKRNTAFIVELIIMFLLLLLVISVITTISMKTRQQSIDAKHLTEAVICAQNAAEVTAAASDAESCAARLEKMEEAKNVKVNGSSVEAGITSGSGEKLRLVIDVGTEKGSTGKYVTKDIAVFLDKDKGADAKKAGSAKPVYTLSTGDFVKGGAS